MAVELAAQPSGRPAGHAVVLVTLDGARWQEVFGGLDLEVLQSASGKTPAAQTDVLYEALLGGQRHRPSREADAVPVDGDWPASTGSSPATGPSAARCNVTNRHRFSYPGYNELLTGAPTTTSLPPTTIGATRS